MEFNLQTFLSEMRDEQRKDIGGLREEQRNDHAEISGKVDKITEWTSTHQLEDQKAFASLDIRLRPVESVLRTVRHVLVAVVIIVLGAAITEYYVHSAKEGDAHAAPIRSNRSDRDDRGREGPLRADDLRIDESRSSQR